MNIIRVWGLNNFIKSEESRPENNNRRFFAMFRMR